LSFNLGPTLFFAFLFLSSCSSPCSSSFMTCFSLFVSCHHALSSSFMPCFSLLVSCHRALSSSFMPCFSLFVCCHYVLSSLLPLLFCILLVVIHVLPLNIQMNDSTILPMLGYILYVKISQPISLTKWGGVGK
jgi:hypothetical protein